jgi:sterol desaturase/sphingolipid hydroxylase (fatty acid hydroxylase superfamily)
MRALPHPLSLVISLAILALLFYALHRLNRREFPYFRREWKLDVAYWFVTPWVSGLATRALVILTSAPLILLMGISIESLRRDTYAGFGPLARQPIALQALEIFLLGDLVVYWMHRLFHGKRLWAFHSIHHSSTEVDWLSSVRLHPVNEAVTRAVEVVPLLLFGFKPYVLAAYVPVLTLYAIFLHANLDWDLGPLRWLIASPVFHRWHHSKVPEALDKNFAGFFVLWDVLFGTFYMPRGRMPEDFGVTNPVPNSLWGQLAHPFRRGNASARHPRVLTSSVSTESAQFRQR